MNRSSWVICILSLALLPLLGACRPISAPAGAGQSAAPAPILSTEEQAMAAATVEFIAASTATAPESLVVQSVEAVMWSDAALGCPQPDMIYAAVVTPGYKITVTSADATYTVHTDSRADGEKIICPES